METQTQEAALKAPEIREEPKQEVVMALPMELSTGVKKINRQKALWPTTELYIDRPVKDGGFGSFAADGREFLGIDASLVKSLLRHYSVNQGIAYQMIAPIKVCLCGTDERPLRVVLNGRQRVKEIEYINRIMQKVYDMWLELDRNRVRLTNVLISKAQAARNGVQDVEGLDFSMFEDEDIIHLVGGKVNGETVNGFLTKSKDTEEGPLPYYVRVEYVDVDPNTPDALRISAAERISVPTPPSTEAKQISRLLAAGLSLETVAADFGCVVKSLHNKMLILHVLPQVQEAVDLGPSNGGIAWKTLKEMFFVETAKRGIVAKKPEEQLMILDKLIGGGSNKFQQAAAREEMKTFPADLKCVACEETLTIDNSAKLLDGSYKHIACKAAVPKPTPAPVVAAPVVPTTAAPSNGAPAASPMNTASATVPAPGSAPLGSPIVAPPKPVKEKKHDLHDSSVLRYFPLAAKIVRKSLEELPPPSMESGAETYWKQKENVVRLDTAAAIVDYLGGDAKALDEHAELKKIIIESISQAQADMEASAKEAAVRELEMKGQTPKQRLATECINLFSAWEELDVDERGEWPVIEPDEDDKPLNEQQMQLKEVLGQIQATYAEKLESGDEDWKREYQGNTADFARWWVVSVFLES